VLRITLAAALLGATAAPAFAATDLTRTSDGFTYFNKAGADLAAHDAAVRECRTVAGQMHQPGPMTPSYTMVVPAGVSPMAAGIGGAIGMAIAMAIQQGIADHKGQPVNVENCMVVKGWRVVALDDLEGKAFPALKKDAQAAQLSQWVGAAEPHGKVVRTFANDAVEGDQKALFSPATHVGVAVSADLVAKPSGKDKATATPAAYLPPATPPKLPRRAKAAEPPKPLADADLGGIPADQGLIVVNVRGDAQVAVSLQRMGPDPATPAWVDGHPADILVVRPVKAFAKAGAAEGATYVYAVPPGRWRLENVEVNSVSMSFCLGGPAFDLAAGEAVYAGSFNPSNVVPDMQMEAAKAAFPSVSPVVEKLKPADWVNGVQAQCRGAYAYALELPARPFVDSYALGSKAQPPAVAKAAVPVTPAGPAASATPAGPPASSTPAVPAATAATPAAGAGGT
jgi:hypothetical protein